MKSDTRKNLAEEERIAIPCEPIVSPELWQKVQDRPAQNKKFSLGNAKQFFLLRGLLRYKECGKSLVSGTAGHKYYECYGTRDYLHTHQCRKPHRINADLFERYCRYEIIDKIQDLTSENDAIGYLLDEFEASKATVERPRQRTPSMRQPW